MSITPLVNQLKEAGEDFEFYPTTKEIIEAMYWDIKSHRLNAYYGYDEENISHVCKTFFKHEFQIITLLDIGAGDGKVYKTLMEISQNNYNPETIIVDGEEFKLHKEERSAEQLGIDKYMAIEKSQMLINKMPDNAWIVGTEFDECTLIDKRSQYIFCNPPYSKYVEWTAKIIKEANADYIYLVIPRRWGENKIIGEAIKKREAKVDLVGSFDFENSEDRKARAKVSLLKLTLIKEDRRCYGEDNEPKVSPFDLWFDEVFSIKADKENRSWEYSQKERQGKIDNQLVKGNNLVTTLVGLYEHELGSLIKSYQKIAELDPEIFKELNVNIRSVKGALKEKIKGLKNLYWEKIFDNLEEITRRLTSSSRASLLGTLFSNTNIDFSEANIRNVVIWVIKNANKYFESQMISMYDKFTTGEGIKLYKSNQHFNKDDWRYARRNNSLEKYALDYRVVLYSCIGWREERDKKISEEQIENIRDIIVVAKNLGFNIDYGTFDKEIYWGDKSMIYFIPPSDRKLKAGTKTNLGKINEVYELDEKYDQGKYQYEIGGMFYHWSSCKVEDDIFTTVKGYKNGNTHYQFNQRFMKKLNLEVGRLRGWLKTPQEAAQEFDITEEEAISYWNSSFTLLPSNAAALLPIFSLGVEGDEEESIEEPIVNLEDKSALPKSLFDFGGLA